MVEPVDQALAAQGKPMDEDTKREMRTLKNGDGGRQRGQPGKREFAQLLDSEEAYRREIEIIGGRHDRIAQDHTGEQVEDDQEEDAGEHETRERREPGTPSRS